MRGASSIKLPFFCFFLTSILFAIRHGFKETISLQYNRCTYHNLMMIILPKLNGCVDESERILLDKNSHIIIIKHLLMLMIGNSQLAANYPWNSIHSKSRNELVLLLLFFRASCIYVDDRSQYSILETLTSRQTKMRQVVSSRFIDGRSF